MTEPTPLAIEDILGRIKQPERAYRLCVRPDLRTRWEDLDRRARLAEREASSSLAGSSKEAKRLAAECQAVEQEMETATVPLLLRALTHRAFSDLLAMPEHKPRKAKDEQAFNVDTFGVALLAASAVDPQMSLEQAGQLVDRLTTGQWNDLFNVCWSLNQGSVDVPKSRSASGILHSTPTS